MKVRIIEEECIGCGACVDGCPAVFAMDDAVARVTREQVPAGDEEAVRDAAQGCPTEAIVVEE